MSVFLYNQTRMYMKKPAPIFKKTGNESRDKFI